ncbi:unnamed protein product [Bathycoccus prasinos]
MQMMNRNNNNNNNNIYCQFTSTTIANGGNHPPECKCYSRILSSYDQSLEELKFQKSACHFAQIGNVEKLKQLLENDFERWTNSIDTQLSGLTPLHYASRNGHSECVKLLLEKKYACKVNARTTSGNSTALMRASATGEAEIVEMLLKAGADASLRDDDGETALHKVYTFIRQEKRRNEDFEEERRKRAEMKFEKIVKALVAELSRKRRRSRMRGEKPCEREI